MAPPVQRLSTSEHPRLDYSEPPLLDRQLLPSSLYESSSGVLSLPPALVEAYLTVLQRHGLSARAAKGREDASPVGGPTQEATDEHFAHAFDGSAARTQLAILDPKGHATRVSNAFLEVLSGTQVCLLDAACGAGAASLTLLTCIGELRARSVLPRMPLCVALIGAELSTPARVYAAAMLEQIQPFLESQAIFVTPEFIKWDVLDEAVNADLIQRLMHHSPPPCKRLLVVANFSAFLARDGKLKKATPQLDSLFLHASRTGAVAVWIEPSMNHAVKNGGLFQELARRYKKWRSGEKEQGADSDASAHYLTECDFRTAVNNGQATARLAVIRFNLDPQ